MPGKVSLLLDENGVYATGGKFLNTTQLADGYKIFKLSKFLTQGIVVLEPSVFSKTALNTLTFNGSNNVTMSQKAFDSVINALPLYITACKLLKDNKTPFEGDISRPMTIKLKKKKKV